MKAIVCNALGPPDKLTLEDLPDPVPGDGQVVIDVRACGVNFVDALFVQGLYQIRPDLPFVPGGEVAGVVASMGKGVEGVAVGDRVIALPGLNGFADRVGVSEKALIPLPTSLDFERGAAVVQSYCTALFALTRRTQVDAGETLLVLGAAGGVGLAAIDVGKSLGARVIAAASTDEKLSFAASLGADHTINYTEQELKSAVRELTDGRGVDVVFDPVGGDLSETAFRAIAWNGRYLVIGFAAGDIPAIPLNLPLLKGASIVGVYWGDWLIKEPRQAAEVVAELYELAATGRVDPRVSDVFALEEFADGYAALINRAARGKVLLRVSE